MNRSRFLFCVSGAAVCGVWFSAGLAYNLGPGQAGKVLAGGVFVAGCGVLAVSAVWAVARLAGLGAALAEPGAAADGGA